MSEYKLIVIGGGAAGFFGAITSAERGLNRILILEKSKEVLTKVRISGGGRCNVTHSCFDPKTLTQHYPRGHKSLHGPFHRWNAQNTIDWFESHGVELKTEEDGRMFPTSNCSETIINCLLNSATQSGVDIRTKAKVTGLEVLNDGSFAVHLSDSVTLKSEHVLIATGGLRGGEARNTVKESGHDFSAPVPSLFTFHIDDPRLTDLQGVSIPQATLKAAGMQSQGPVLITHWGLSGPGILKLSAWAARELSECQYCFTP